jgi:AraC family transcriptional regulator, regulatory protein of adaptative response / methylated-DNA-[protein]-cysteine methyltransferase
MSALNLEQCWEKVLLRDKSADGEFVTAVKTTRIYCRPSCRARHPKRENVTFFQLPAQAESSGFRACKLCLPKQARVIDPQAHMVQQVADRIHALLESGDDALLDTLSEYVGYTASHVQSVFKAMLGVSPKQYADQVRMAQFKARLRDGEAVTDAVFAAGYGSSSRVYERADSVIGMTPSAYRKGGKGATITFTTAESVFGWVLIAMTARGICKVSLHDSVADAEAHLEAEFPHAALSRDDAGLHATLCAILDHVSGKQALPDLAFDIQATAFQWRVWNALRQIPRGETRTYSQVAAMIGQPNAVRAVASACAHNKAAIVIPCHRVIGKDGSLTGYEWGVERKRALLAEELV